MRVAFLTIDNRENFRQYGLNHPVFGTAPSALLEGFAMLGDKREGKNPEIRKSGEGDIGQSIEGEQETVSPLEIHVISCTQKKTEAPEKLAPKIWFHSLHVPKSGWLRSGYLGCAIAVRKKLRQIRPDIIHAQGTERDCAVSAMLSPYPRILTIHGNLRLIRKQVGFRRFSPMWFQSFLEGLVVPRFDGVVCITNYTKEAVEHEVPRTWVVPNAVDPSFLPIGESRLSAARPRGHPPTILVVANIDPRKNQNELIRALDPLSGQRSFRVRFFGASGDNAYCEEFQRLVAGRPWCSYGGMIGREELKAEFSAADALVLPTLEDNCPMVVLEAMASGVPVIASRVGGIPDLIDGEKTGLYADPSHPESFRICLEKLLEDAAFAERMAADAFSAALSRFHPKVIAARHVQIYKEVLGQ